MMYGETKMLHDGMIVYKKKGRQVIYGDVIVNMDGNHLGFKCIHRVPLVDKDDLK